MNERREKHHRYPWPIIEMAVLWYQRYDLPYRAVSDLMLARGIEVSHKTVYEWVQKFGTAVGRKAKKRTAAVKPLNYSVDESYVKVNGDWRYLYRIVDKTGTTLNAVVRSRKDLTTARNLLKKTFEQMEGTA